MKEFSLWYELGIYSLKFPRYCIAVVAIVPLYITPLLLIYLVTGGLYLLTTFLHFFLPSLFPASGNYKSDIIFFSMSFF